MKRIFMLVLTAVLLGVFVFSGYQIYHKTEFYRESQRLYDSLLQYIISPEEQVGKQQENGGQTADAAGSDNGEASNIVWPQVDFAALQKINPEIVGWIYNEGTVINYPVAHGTDNDFYLFHMFDRSFNYSGCIFLDMDNQPDFSDQHSILYGHHMRNGSMFQSLKGYTEQEYYEEHPVLLLMTPQQNYQIVLFSGYVSKTSSNAWQQNFSSEEEKEAWLASVKAQSTFQCDVTPTASDRIITLSTCSYEFNDARFVVHGILK